MMRLLDLLREAIRNDDWAEARRISTQLSSAVYFNRASRASQVSPALEMSHLELLAGRDVASRGPLLGRLARAAYNAGQYEKAEYYAKEALEAAKNGKFDWTGDAVHQGNIVLGRLAFSHADLDLAQKYLLEAGKAPHSLTLAALGPSMALANELLLIGKREVVVQYLLECRSLWSVDKGKLEEWIALVRAGLTPDFGPNTYY